MSSHTQGEGGAVGVCQEAFKDASGGVRQLPVGQGRPRRCSGSNISCRVHRTRRTHYGIRQLEQLIASQGQRRVQLVPEA